MSWYRYYNYYPRTRARQAKGGIKAQSKRGQFGQSWWAKRWIEVLESFNIGARLGRGRSYARQGQVIAIDIEKGRVTAKVQGSQRQPYKVAIKVKTLTQTDWKKLARLLAKQALFAAKLLAGEMPENIEQAFQNAKLTLFPNKRGDLQTDCSCPDWSNPCKHIAAVYYLLGEEFDRDPFLIFRLRGMEQKELVNLLGGQQTREDKSQSKKVLPELAAEQKEAPAPPPVPLPTDPETFWGWLLTDEVVTGEVFIPPIAAALPKRLGNFPFWRGEENFLSAMEEVYRKASPVGVDVFLGEQKFQDID
ncbi:MAG: hypothetical protein AMJ79_12465 [Phycisphaerae bacterium SM23_30]|nr:MAG: hypothetical protein AMJ79_12465 [Phycisphaerae bacterium SM23_30]